MSNLSEGVRPVHRDNLGGRSPFPAGLSWNAALAHHMRVLSADFSSKLEPRIIDIHHSLLPAFAGGHPYHPAYLSGVTRIGATAHYATPDLYEGPNIERAVATRPAS